MNFPPGRRGMFRVSWGMTGKWGLENVENAKGTMASLLVETPVPRGGVKTKWIPGRFFWCCKESGESRYATSQSPPRLRRALAPGSPEDGAEPNMTGSPPCPRNRDSLSAK